MGGFDILQSPWWMLLTVAIVSFLSYLVCSKLILPLILRTVGKTRNKWDDILLNSLVLKRLFLFVPAIILYNSAKWLPGDPMMVRRGIFTYLLVVIMLTVNGIISTLVNLYGNFQISRHKPVKSYAQLLKIINVFLSVIFIVATLLDRSPWKLLTGIGALSAVLMLVFKDSILSLVASVQLSANDMVRIGDWIVMSNHGADGDVIDISLHTVKVQNWDKTISTIPTHELISGSFVNWRGMSESGGRRIKRAVNIDMNSVGFCSNEQLERFRKIDCLKSYIDSKCDEIAKHNEALGIDTSEVANGRRLTNLGTFRAYLVEYLKKHPMIYTEGMTFLVRQLAPTAEGVPMEIYVFSKDQVWVNYEAIQGDIFDHILAVLPEFGLRVFQNPTGADFRAMTAAGK